MGAKDRVGRAGEQLAREWLTRQGLQILDANWRCPIGELDIVALDGDELAFVEVKTRTSTAFGHPAESITRAKLARLRRLAGAWVAVHDVHASGMRIDVVAILRRSGEPTLVEHVQGVG
ncbi:YraN family protein [Pseudactinotalea suaedae]|jgi:putative endonuclease|uniref:YraN family protein n=1 Tax=Pseudactinotalea suaedae TaxID=1524924 RepID=UPI0012E1E920|nr:YraN family protein [Pseudactinotalea suaedae]